MGDVGAPYLATLAAVIYRWAHAGHRPPPPFAFLGATAVFGVCSIIAGESASLGKTLGWGFFIAAALSPQTQQPLNVLGIPPLTISQAEGLSGALGGTAGPGTTGSGVPSTQKEQGPNGTLKPVPAGIGSIQGFIQGLTGKSPSSSAPASGSGGSQLKSSGLIP